MNANTSKLKGFLVLLMFISCASSHAQDTIHITLPEAENLFREKNLFLLAAKYNIDIGKAQLIQAKLYNNPGLSFSGNLYNPGNQKFADLSGKTGEYAIGLQRSSPVNVISRSSWLRPG